MSVMMQQSLARGGHLWGRLAGGVSCSLRAFSVLSPRLWKSLPGLLRDTSLNATSIGRSLKTFSPRVLVHTVR